MCIQVAYLFAFPLVVLLLLGSVAHNFCVLLALLVVPDGLLVV
jgi:hypothetical protein